MSQRYIFDRFLPDKAIDLVDEAASHVKTQMNSEPSELEDLNRRIVNLETQYAALIEEKDEESRMRAIQTSATLKELKAQQEVLTEDWNLQKKLYTDLNKTKEEISQTQTKIEKFQSEGLYTEASKLVYIELPGLQKKLTEIDEEIKKSSSGLFKTVVTENEIADVVARMTNIPVKKVLQAERTKLLNLNHVLSERVKGQPVALKKIANAILRSRAGINDPNRPIGSFLFLGPTGVGKTEVAKALAEALFDNEKMIARFDMSEFMEKHAVSKLIGAPPGYVGFEQAGSLTEIIRRRPYSVVLFDEIEKAHVDLLNLLLQILDEGFLTDNKNRRVNFRNTIIIMTTNVASSLILANKEIDALQEVHKIFKPEFINRIDDIVVFNTLSHQAIRQIVCNQLVELKNRVFHSQKITIEFSNEVVDDIVKNGYDATFGARPIKRYIQNTVENLLATEIVNDKVKRGCIHLFKYDQSSEKYKLFYKEKLRS